MTEDGNFYVTGGTLATDAACYVDREADRRLFEAVQQGQFCYVLTARQMGKSSLMVRCVKKLRAAGVATVVLDLTAIGQNLTVEQWYVGLIDTVAEQLDLNDALEDLLDAHSDEPPFRLWSRALTEVVLPQSPDRLVLFIDEIDSVKSLPFSSDEFFAGIRSFYNRRESEPLFRNLSVCLLGTATPNELIANPATTPFNIGERIELSDFTPEEAATLRSGLSRSANPSALLNRVLHWTEGHPYLTQRLCRSAVLAEHWSESEIDELCGRLFFDARSEGAEDNLVFVRHYLTQAAPDLVAALKTYERLLRRPMPYQSGRPELDHLLISGVVKTTEEGVRVRNPIYRRVFDKRWCRNTMPDAELRRQRRASIRGASVVGGISLLVIAALLVLTLLAIQRGDDAQRATRKARSEQLHKDRILFATRMNLAYVAWQRGNSGRTRELLQMTAKLIGGQDPRGFEWHWLQGRVTDRPPTYRSQLTITSSNLSPDGRWLVLAGRGGLVSVWDTRRWSERLLQSHKGAIVSAAAFSPDGRQLATAGRGQLVIWSMPTLSRVGAFRYPGRAMTMSFGRELVLITLADSLISVKLSTGARREYKQLEQVVALGPNGGTLLARTRKPHRTVRLRLSDGKLSPLLPFSTSFGALSRDGRWAALAGMDAVHLVEIVGNKRQRLPYRTSAIAFSVDSKLLALSLNDSRVLLWNLTTQREMAVLRGHDSRVVGLAFTADGKELLSTTQRGVIRRWPIPPRPNPWTLPRLQGKTLVASAIFPRRQLAVTAGATQSIALWSLATGKLVRLFKGHTDMVWAVVPSPDGRRLASSSWDGTLRLWDVDSGRQLRVMRGHQGHVRGLAFTPDGQRLVSGGQDGTIRIWDTGSGKIALVLRGHRALVMAVAVTPDGRLIISGSSDRTVKLWSTTRSEPLATLGRHPSQISSMSLSSDGRLLATGDRSGQIQLWNVPGRRLLRAIKGHATHVWGLDIGGNCRRLVSASFDGQIKLWDLITGQQTADLPGKRSWIFDARFSPDSTLLLAVGSLSRILVWDRLPHKARLQQSTWRPTEPGSCLPVIAARPRLNRQL